MVEAKPCVSPCGPTPGTVTLLQYTGAFSDCRYQHMHVHTECMEAGQVAIGMGTVVDHASDCRLDNVTI